MKKLEKLHSFEAISGAIEDQVEKEVRRLVDDPTRGFVRAALWYAIKDRVDFGVTELVWNEVYEAEIR